MPATTGMHGIAPRAILKRYWRIFNRLTKKYVKLDDGSFAVFEYPIQAEKYILLRLNNSKVYKVIEFRKR